MVLQTKLQDAGVKYVMEIEELSLSFYLSREAI
jgi:hypothetical protein